jgi:predicted dehydrogenase
MVAAAEVDAVVVASPNTTHAELAVMALEAGKHVIVEKPLALNAKEASKIVEAAEKSGKTTMVPHQMRWNPGSQKLHALTEKGELGDIYYAKTTYLRQSGIPGWGSWFTRFNESGGGPLIDIGVHMLDLALYQMGNPKPVSVFGSTYAKFGPEKRGLGTWGTPDWDGYYDVEDLASALIKMDNGATLFLEVSWAANIDAVDAKSGITIMGSEGGARLEPGSGDFTLSGQKFGECFSVNVAAQGPPAREAMTKHFIECAKEGAQTIAPVYSGMVNNLVLDAIYESAKTGKSVDIDWSVVE